MQLCPDRLLCNCVRTLCCATVSGQTAVQLCPDRLLCNCVRTDCCATVSGQTIVQVPTIAVFIITANVQRTVQPAARPVPLSEVRPLYCHIHSSHFARLAHLAPRTGYSHTRHVHVTTMTYHSLLTRAVPQICRLCSRNQSQIQVLSQMNPIYSPSVV